MQGYAPRASGRASKPSTLRAHAANEFEASVLLVEDELQVRNAVSRELRRRRFQVLLARSSHEAVQTLSTHTPDAIVLDLGLPDADGVALLRALRQRGIQIPVVVYTGRTLPSNVIAAIEQTGARIVYKTVSTEPLFSALDGLLGGRWIADGSEGDPADIPTFQQALSRRLMRASVRDAEIPILDGRVPELQRIVQDQSAPVEPVLEIVESDPRLTAAVLAEVNSAFYGCAKSISDARRACIQLGAPRVAALATQAILEGTFRTDREPFRSLSQSLWIESVVCARLSSRIASLMKAMDPDEVYTLALLHNVGELVVIDLASRLPYDMGDSEAEALFLELENNHERIGALLMERWDLPSAFRQLAGSHHPDGRLEDQRVPSPEAVIRTAWELAAEVVEARLSWRDDHGQRFELLGLQAESCATLREEARAWPSQLRRS